MNTYIVEIEQEIKYREKVLFEFLSINDALEFAKVALLSAKCADIKIRIKEEKEGEEING